MRYDLAIKTGAFLYGAAEAVTYGHQENEQDDMSAASINQWAKLKDLEYLWVPGPFLHPDTIATIESFPKLKELHALHTAVDPAVLRRVAELKGLRKLSVGISKLNDEFLQILAHLGHLEVLQLYIIDIDYEDREQTLKKAHNKLQELLPDVVEIHVIHHEGLTWIED